MPLENANYISELVDTNPLSDDPVNQGDDQIRQTKRSLQANVLGDVNGTQLLVNNLIALALTRAPGPVVTLLNEAQLKLMDLGFLAGDDLTLLNDTAAGLLILAGANPVFEGDPLGRSRMFNAGIERIAAEALGASVTGELSVTLDIACQNLIANVQAIANAPAPTLAEHLTRKDYVDPIGAQADANTAQIGVNTGDIAANAAQIGTNTGGIAANTGDLAGINGVPANQQIVVDDMQLLAGRSGVAAASSITVVFDVPFTANPHVVVSAWNPSNVNNAFGWVRAVSTTQFTATFPTGIACEWQAMGTKT